MTLIDLATARQDNAARPKTGIVHLGLGAFFRSHAAIFIQDAMDASGGDWGVVGVSLRSAGTRNALRDQNWAYSATSLSDNGRETQIITVLNGVFVAPEDPETVLAVMSHPDTKIVSLTVTEKGYCHVAGSGKLDLKHPDIIHDIDAKTPKSAPGYIVRALQRRREQELDPFTVLSLDNLPSNGGVARRVVCDLADAIDPSLKDWIETCGKFPSTMVDRIVPATTATLLEDVEQRLGVRDAAPVGHEPFRQWVIEDDFVGGERPDFTGPDAMFVGDVTEFEDMKLRLLNGAHSALAYIGRMAGFTTVSEAMSDPVLATFLRRFWRYAVIPSLVPPDGIDLLDYTASLEKRFLNKEIEHSLRQISMDGSQKLPQRILAPLFDNVKAMKPYRSLLLVLAVWIKYLAGKDDNGRDLEISDPLFEELAGRLAAAKTPVARARAVCGFAPVFGTYPVDLILPELEEMLDQLDETGTLETVGAIET